MTNRKLVNIFAYECSKNTTDFYKRGNSMHICNNRLYSYATCIAEYTQEGLIINDTRYSKTTSRHQSYVRLFLNKYAKHHANNVPRGTDHLIYFIEK